MLHELFQLDFDLKWKFPVSSCVNVGIMIGRVFMYTVIPINPTLCCNCYWSERETSVFSICQW